MQNDLVCFPLKTGPRTVQDTGDKNDKFNFLPVLNNSAADLGTWIRKQRGAELKLTSRRGRQGECLLSVNLPEFALLQPVTSLLIFF